jgi:hypothetical protein
MKHRNPQDVVLETLALQEFETKEDSSEDISKVW